MLTSQHFDWDEENITHIARHGVAVEEVEFALLHETLDPGFQDWHEEERFREIGQTATGRLPAIVTTDRGVKTRVVSAFDADSAAKRSIWQQVSAWQTK